MKFISILTLALMFSTSQVAFSADTTIEELARKVEALEKKQSSGTLKKISENITLSGVVEVEAGGEDNNQSGKDSSDIALATVELGIDSEVADNISGHVLLLWEEGEGPVEVDEGTITIESTYGAGLIAGKQYIPFGNFDSHFISDPLTLELGETNESTIILTYGTNLFEVAVGGFNGDVDKKGDDKIDDFVASLTIFPSENFSIGVSYLSDLSDTDAEITGLTSIKGDTAGVSAFINLTLGDINLIAEYLGADVEFDLADLDQNTDGRKDKPSTYNVELAYTISDSTQVAIKAEGSNDLGDGTDVVEEQYGVAASFGIAKNTSLAFEYMDGRFEEKGLDKNGNPADRDRQLYTAQLAIEF